MSSCGIILKNHNEYLMVERRYSYALFDLVFHPFNIKNKYTLIKLLHKTLLEEKYFIDSYTYDQLWELILHKKFPPKKKKEKYLNLRQKYKSIFDNIWNYNYIDKVWEFPKGRRKEEEDDTETAMREFEEETSINRGMYKLHKQYVIYNIYDNNIKYPVKYYMATLSSDRKQINLKPKDTREISSVRWVLYNDICILNPKLKGLFNDKKL